MLNFCDFIQVYVFTTNHHLKSFSWPIGSDNLLHKICCLSLKIKLLPVTKTNILVY